MAHQFSAAPSHGAQYSATPFYSPFASSTVQQMTNGIPGLQQPNTQHQPLQAPTDTSNTVRYDANAHNHAQTAPLPFAPHFNPELLKHFPPPPPPPPPGAHFGAIPSPGSAFLAFSQVTNLPPHPTAQQHFPHYLQQGASPNGIPIPHQSATPTNDPRLYNPMTSLRGAVGTLDQVRSQESPAQGFRYDQATGSARARLSDAIEDVVDTQANRAQLSTLDNNSRRDSSNTFGREQQVAPSSSVAQAVHTHRYGSDSQPEQAVSLTELKERAKAALLSLMPHNIRYDEIRAEGIDAQVLQQLYEDLGLNWQSPLGSNRTDLDPITVLNSQRTTANQQSGSVVTDIPLASIAVASSSTKPTIAAIPLAVAPTAPNQNMERKDRIAQLLAAKAGKAVNIGTTSKSQSPASTAEPLSGQASEPDVAVPAPSIDLSKAPSKVAQTDLVRQKIEKLKKEAIPRARKEHGQEPITIQPRGQQQQTIDELKLQDYQAAALPTPIREHLAQNGFSSLIPGLFLRAAEPEEDDGPLPIPTSQMAPVGPSFASPTAAQPEQLRDDAQARIAQTLQESRKRSIEEDIDSTIDNPHSPKRQTTQLADSFDASMESDTGAASDDASEGEIIEEETAPQEASIPIVSHTQNRPQLVSDQQNYDSKPLETEVLRKRIAGIGQRQDLSRGQSSVVSPSGSNTSTPTIHATSVNVLSSPVSKGVDSPRSLLKATPEQIAERAAQLKADFLRSRALRQKQLQEGIPALDDEVAKTRNKLKQAREKLSHIHSEIQQQQETLSRAFNDKQTTEQEIENLEKQLSDGVSGQKQYSNELNNLRQDSSKVPAVQPTTISNNSNNRSRDHSSQDRISKVDPPHMLEIESHHIDLDAGNTLSEMNAAAHTSEHSRAQSHISEQQSATFYAVNTEEDKIHSRDAAEIVDLSVKSSRVQSPLITASASSVDQRGDKSMEYMHDSDEAMEESDDNSDDSHMSIDEETNGSVSMSDSGSDDYEPADPGQSPQTDDKMDSDEYEPAVENSQQLNGPTEEGDEYEPAESLSPEDNTAVSLSPGSAQISLSPADTNSEVSGGDSTSQKNGLMVSEVPTAPNQTGVDDREKGLQLSEADTLTKPQNLPAEANAKGSNVLGADDSASVRFVPYQSPLTSLKSYRFHPSFNDNVRNGYRSLTYSHKIDPKSPICLAELGGNLCTDPNCQDQHFGSMALTDDKILVQMSSASDIKDKKLRDQFLIGLKQVIARLRQEGVKDFTAVADALSHYRREWKAAQAGS